jgi:uncharacterized protein (DUF433 family)
MGVLRGRDKGELQVRDDELLKRIEVNPRVMLGKPVIQGTRVPVEQILRKLAKNIAMWSM